MVSQLVRDPLDEGQLARDAGDTGGHPDRVVAFGKTFAWKDGLAVKVSKPRAFKPSPEAFVNAVHGRMGKEFLAVTVQVNRTGKDFDPAWFAATLPPGKMEAGPVMDKENGIGVCAGAISPQPLQESACPRFGR